ncbi:hypothetical protein KY362_05865, partial [Candidatus Woesearchaeota archaeon]|nr:hypothetical protein [Candidatus Woesearchaeota archaeon]
MSGNGKEEKLRSMLDDYHIYLDHDSRSLLEDTTQNPLWDLKLQGLVSNQFRESEQDVYALADTVRYLRKETTGLRGLANRIGGDYASLREGMQDALREFRTAREQMKSL